MVLHGHKWTLRHHHGYWWKAETDSSYTQVCWRMPSLEYKSIYFCLYFPAAAELTSIRTCEEDIKYTVNGRLGDLAKTFPKCRRWDKNSRLYLIQPAWKCIRELWFQQALQNPKLQAPFQRENWTQRSCLYHHFHCLAADFSFTLKRMQI